MSWAGHVRHFQPGEPGLNDPTGTRLSVTLMRALDAARHDLGIPFVVTSGYRDPERNRRVGGATSSAHLTGEAIDGYFVGDLPLLAQAVHLLRYRDFTAVGLYPYTTPPVVHVDVKPRGPTTLVWLRDAQGRYHYAMAPTFLAEFRRLLAG